MPVINDLTVGYSFSGAQAYVDNLNAKAITETKILLANIGGIRTALTNGWSGTAVVNFLANIEKAIKQKQDELDTLKKVFDGRFAEIEANAVDEDETIVPLI